MKKYNIIHPGYVRSQNDGEMHRIGYLQLIRLYRLNPSDCLIADWPEHMSRVTREKHNHYFPRFDGKYYTPPTTPEEG